MHNLILTPIPITELNELIKSAVSTALNEIKNINSPQDSDQLLTVPQAAEFLSISVASIYSLINQKKLPVIKRLKRCYFSKQELIDYIKEGRRKTLEEIETEARIHINSFKK